MCHYVDHPNVAPGWGCCGCRMYNGVARGNCKGCAQLPCQPLAADPKTGRTREQAAPDWAGLLR